MSKFYLTTAIDYANAAPHIGHAYEKIGADILARFHRLAGKDVFFLAGLDEHGSKVEKTAEAAGKTPQAFVDEIAAKFVEAWKLLGISNNYYIRTTEERHKKVVQEVFRKMRDKGDVYKGKYQGLYCEGCEDHLRERDLVDGKCPNHNKPPIEFVEENYFFRLSKYKEPLRKWLTETEGCVLPEGRKQEVLNQLDDPEFGDFSISRDKEALRWGIPVPDDEDQVIYVWIDALTNYITGVGYLTDDALWKRYWPADLHLIGKDIVKFHTLYWPAMLMACEVELPKLVFGHGFITVEKQKMSKTLGNVIDPVYLAKTYPPDAVRYFLFATNTFEQDGDFSVARFIEIVNAHLANSFGNLANRTMTQVEKNCEGKVPAGTANAASVKIAEEAFNRYVSHMERLEFAKAIEAAMDIVTEANRYLNEQEPWNAFNPKKEKTDEDRVHARSVLLTSLELIKRATIMLSPVTPNLSAKIWHQLGYDSLLVGEGTKPGAVRLSDVNTPIPAGQAIRNDGPGFMRLEEIAAVASA
jgi:methionyl-tRNA synthetase